MFFRRICLFFVLMALGLSLQLPNLNSETLTCNPDDLRALNGFSNCLVSTIPGWNSTDSPGCYTWTGVTSDNSISFDRRVVGLELGNKRLIGNVKLWFTNMYFVGFYSVPNLIVIIFNLLYLVFIVWFDCKGCVLERESVKAQAIEARRVLTGSSRLSIPRSEACVLHMTGMRRVSTDRDSCVLRVSRG